MFPQDWLCPSPAVMTHMRPSGGISLITFPCGGMRRFTRFRKLMVCSRGIHQIFTRPLPKIMAGHFSGVAASKLPRGLPNCVAAFASPMFLFSNLKKLIGLPNRTWMEFFLWSVGAFSTYTDIPLCLPKEKLPISIRECRDVYLTAIDSLLTSWIQWMLAKKTFHLLNMCLS